MFLRNCWYVAGWSHHFPEDDLVTRTILGDPIVLYRKGDGGVVALENRCCHRFAPLSRGRKEGDDLRCMYHGLKFAPSGRCIEIPQQDIIPSTAVVRSYPVVEQDCWVWIWMGEPGVADARLIPRALNHDHPGWLMLTGELTYDANYELINDNLLDLTHLSYVHQSTLGRNSMSWGESRPKTARIERGPRIERWVVNHPRPNYLGLPPGSLSDMWASYDYVVPGVFLLGTKSYPTSMAADCRMLPPTAEPDWVSSTSQAVTPISEHQTIYYYSSCLSRTFATEEHSRQQMAVIERAFAEDRAMIEAQQDIIASTPEARMLRLSSDGALNQFRRLMAGLIDAEQVPGVAASSAAEVRQTREEAPHAIA
jgi:phenylpropionate dioxygenase-like ring-hydroxylating dioxygenase large terminal subunit